MSHSSHICQPPPPPPAFVTRPHLSHFPIVCICHITRPIRQTPLVCIRQIPCLPHLSHLPMFPYTCHTRMLLRLHSSHTDPMFATPVTLAPCFPTLVTRECFFSQVGSTSSARSEGSKTATAAPPDASHVSGTSTTDGRLVRGEKWQRCDRENTWRPIHKPPLLF